MAIINRSSVIQSAADILALQSGKDKLPSISIDNVQPVVELVKFSNIARHSSSGGAGTTTVYTTPPDKDFFITSISISVTKNVTCDAILCYGQAFQGGVLRRLVQMDFETVTAESRALSVSFPYPVEIDRNTAISIYINYAAGAAVKSICMTGILIE
jgi:hypothetical protein